MNQIIDVIKRGNRSSEPFDRKKLHQSIVSTCLSVRTPRGQAETTAHSVCDEVMNWIQNKDEVTSHDIRTITAKKLKRFHPEAAYLYEQHNIII
jgi:transcriptional regulator NrdR family protein